MSVGLLGSPVLARSASDSGGLGAPVILTIPKHAVCGRESRVTGPAWTRGHRAEMQQCWLALQ